MQNDNQLLFLPPYLQSLGYGKIPQIKDVSARAEVLKETHIEQNPVWAGWRGIFEYLACVEYGRSLLCSFPTGRELGSQHVVSARYCSASLVFFAQATLDNIAVWVAKRFSMKVKGSDCALHKDKFRNELRSHCQAMVSTLESHDSFILELKKFRMEWIHRLTGGAQVYSDKPPDDPTANICLAVPINPAINSFEMDAKKYPQMVEECRRANGGRWLYAIDEFANKIADGTKDLTVDILDIALKVI